MNDTSTATTRSSTTTTTTTTGARETPDQRKRTRQTASCYRSTRTEGANAGKRQRLSYTVPSIHPHRPLSPMDYPLTLSPPSSHHPLSYRLSYTVPSCIHTTPSVSYGLSYTVLSLLSCITPPPLSSTYFLPLHLFSPLINVKIFYPAHMAALAQARPIMLSID